jgi:hypothetical protein
MIGEVRRRVKQRKRGVEAQEELLGQIAGTGGAINTLWLTSHFPYLSNSSTKSDFLTFLEMFPTNKLILLYISISLLNNYRYINNSYLFNKD